MTLPQLSMGLVAPVGAWVLALAGRFAARRRAGWQSAISALALAAGWAALAGAPRGWWAPRTVVEHLPGAALAVALGALGAAGLRGRAGRGCAVLGVGVAAWWLAGAPAARPEFWRVWFAVAGLAWLVRRMDALAGPRALACAATLALGLAAVGAPEAELGAGLVLLGVALASPRATGLPAAALAVALVAAVLGAGRLTRGTVGMMELVCVAALGAAMLQGWAVRSLRPRLGRAAELAAPVALAAVGVAAAWVGARAIRG